MEKALTKGGIYICKMKNIDKTKEQLISELEENSKLFGEIEASYLQYKTAIEKLLSFEKALETMQLGVTITDLEGKILYINPADSKMHGYTVEELEDANVRILAPSEIWDPLSIQKITSMKRWKRESINKRKDGSNFPVQLMSDVVTNSEGEPVGVVTTCEDITERREMEKEIREKIVELEEFYEMSVGRELRMKELKKEIKKLKVESENDSDDFSNYLKET
jgi:PAS domain S-box-containing protein